MRSILSNQKGHTETRERKIEREFTQKETLKKGFRERERERCIRALALKNANAKSKDNLTF